MELQKNLIDNYNSNYYILYIYLDRNIIINDETIIKYKNTIKNIQSKFEIYKDIESGQITSAEITSFDAGFDLFVPTNYLIDPNTISKKINHGISCSMLFNGIPTAYYLYPRSSMGSKTSLRLSNSVGIIDAGYRGHITGVVDNIDNTNNYEIKVNDRLMQICGPNIMYPIYPILVETIEELGITIRGDGGFGSTGK